MLTIETNESKENEVSYIIEIIIRTFLGLEYRKVFGTRNNFRIGCEGHTGEITLPNVFFQKSNEKWLHPETLPKQPLARWDARSLGINVNLVNPIIPVIFGAPNGVCQPRKGRVELPLDIFGSAFFMLSRYEEAVKPNHDEHGRYPATASLAYEERFLDRPIVDEYAEILWASIQYVWPHLLRPRKARVLRITCDVDWVYSVDWSTKAMCRGVVADIIKRRSSALAQKNFNIRWRARKGDFSEDPFLENIHWMMDINERTGNSVSFHFMTSSKTVLDAKYSLKEKVVRQLLMQISQRGHEIALHPSYNTYKDAKRTLTEANQLRQILDEHKISYTGIGSRQHYLRWSTRSTASNLESANLRYDSTLSYADRAGFRCGTSREFGMYEVVGRRPLRLVQRPLIIMETTVVSSQYEAHGYSDSALDRMTSLKERALAFGGEFTLLWHNSSFETADAREIYKEIIR